MPTHPQVFFKDIKGNPTTVDEGMYDILITLRKMGVHTKYSCQGGEDDGYRAYFLAYQNSIIPLMKTVIWMFLTFRYSKEIRGFVRNWFRGSVKLELRKTKKRDSQRIKRKIKIGFDHSWAAFFEVKFDWSNDLGKRVVIHWPAECNDKFMRLLFETFMFQEKKKGNL